MGMMSATVPTEARPSLMEAKGQPNPENFVPVFDWDAKRVWVWVKKAGGKVIGPTEIPHSQVKKYKGKLGWIAKKVQIIALLDPSTYDDPAYLYPPTWKPGDSLDPEQSLGKPIKAKFEPFKIEPAKPAPMEPPEGFELPPNYTIKNVTPSHVIATTPEGTDVKWIKVTDHWVHADDPTKDHEPLQASVPKKAKPKAKAKPKKKPAKSTAAAAKAAKAAATGTEAPSTPKAKPSTGKPKGKKVVSKDPEKAPHLTKYIGQVDPNGLPLVDEQPEGDFEEEEAAKGLTLLPDDRVARWRPKHGYYLIYDYDPHYGFMFSKSGEMVYPEDAKQLMDALHLTVKNGRYHKYDVAGDEKEQPGTYSAPLPPNCEPIEDKDTNGLPMVKSIPSDEWDDPQVLTLLPNSRLGRWDEVAEKYLYFEWRDILGDYNYYPTQPEQFVGLKEVQKMQAQGAAPAVTPKAPPPTKPKGKPAPVPSKATTAPIPAKKPASPPVLAGQLKPTGDKDPKGYDIGSYKGNTYSMLPDKKVGVWSASNGGYILYKYEPVGDAFYNTATVWTPPGHHKALSYVPISGVDHAQLSDSEGTDVVVLSNGKFARYEKGGWWAYKVDPTQGKKFVPTGEEIDTDTMIDLSEDPAYNTLSPAGTVDENSLPQYKVTSGASKGKVFTMLPNGEMAHYNPKSKFYRLMTFDPDIQGWEISWPKETFTLQDIDAMYLKAGATPIKHPEAPPKAKPKTAPKSKPDTGPEPEPAFVTPEGTLPDPNTLDDMGAKGLKGTTPGRTVLQDPKTGQRYLFKPAIQKFGAGKLQPYKAKSQEGFAAIAAIARPDAHVPVETVEYKGQLGTIQPMMDVDPNQPDLNGVSPNDLTDQQKVDIASEHMLDWLMSQHDSFASNFIITKEGRVVGIDKEQGWRYVNDKEHPDRLATDYKPNTEIYGEQEPYYNKFWRAFAQGKMDFNPEQMAPALAKLEAMDATKLEGVLEDYAATVTRMKGPAKAYERYAFVKQMLSRRATLRADFEKFITRQYEKREGTPGKFTFDQGWIPEGAEAREKTHETLTLTARDWALREFGSSALKPHKDYPEYILVRVTRDEPVTKVQEFLAKMGVEPVQTAPGGGPLPTTNPIMGTNYNSVIVRVSDLEKTVTRKVEIKQEKGQKFANHKGAPTYFSAALAPPAAPGDVKALATAHTEKLGSLGKNFTLDADAVEQQTASVQRVISPEGETYYTVHFKLRKPYWKPLMNAGKSGAYTWPLGAYDETQDALVASSYQGGAHSESGRVFTSGKHKMVILGDSSQWAFRGSVYADIHVKGSTSVLSALTTLMKMAGLDKKVIKDPTPEDIEVYNMTQALWSLSPKKHKALTDSDLNVETLRKKLKGVLTKDQIASIRQVKGTVGRGAPIIPGLWKTLGGGTPDKPVVRFLFWTVNTTSPARIIKSAATGIHERLRLGVGVGKGTSESSDMASGGADATTVRIATVGGKHHGVSNVGSVSRPVKLIIAPEILDRLDIHIASNDSYGCTNPNNSNASYFTGRKGLSQAVKHFNDQGNYGGSTEVVIRRGVPPEMIKRICCSNESDRKDILERMEKAGVTEWNGCPIEDFVVVENNQDAIYNKYLKPLGY